MSRTTSLAQTNRGRAAGLLSIFALLIALVPSALEAQDMGQMTEEFEPPALEWDPNDPRIGLRAGWMDAGEAISNLEKLATVRKPQGFFDPGNPDNGRFTNTDLAFRDDYLFQGNYHGFQIFDISDPTNPELRTSVVCPGGQGDVSVYGDLLVMSAQETRGRLDCGVEGVEAPVSPERLRGIRIFDISNIERPEQVAALQSCRGSHTHTILKDPDDDENLYVYIQGTNSPRPAEELAGCSRAAPEEDPNTSYFRIEVVRVPLADPAAAEIVSEPRIFQDYETGDIAALNEGGELVPGAQRGRQTNQCHDITMYPEMGIAAGACSGNGIILDISDPVNPIRTEEVVDPNFSYWHSATFNNDATTVLFTDEWGGGGAPRCRGTDPATWGADAIFSYEGGELTIEGYYKLPVPQAENEICVAHNGSLIPVPGRDIKVQSWYHGGISVLDFTDPSDAYEIAFFDRGPLSETETLSGGYWSSYWYNGRIYGAEISRGIDVFRLMPSEHLTANEIAAAEMVQFEEFNAQMQPRFVWPDAPPVARAYLDQLGRDRRILRSRAHDVDRVIRSVEAGRTDADGLRSVAADLEADALAVDERRLGGDAGKLRKLASVLRGMAGM